MQNSVDMKPSLRIAIIGQSVFAVDVFNRLLQRGHVIAGVFTVPDKGTREDPLATAAAENNVPVFKIKSWRKAGKTLPDVLKTYTEVNAELNVLPYCSQFIPMEVINYPRLKSICYHPSILPRHRGASSINWLSTDVGHNALLLRLRRVGAIRIFRPPPEIFVDNQANS